MEQTSGTVDETVASGWNARKTDRSAPHISHHIAQDNNVQKKQDYSFCDHPWRQLHTIDFHSVRKKKKMGAVCFAYADRNWKRDVTQSTGIVWETVDQHGKHRAQNRETYFCAQSLLLNTGPPHFPSPEDT